MRAPGAVLAEKLGDLTRIAVLGVEYDLAAEVAIDPAADMEQLLLDNVERVAVWERVVAKCRAQVERLEDGLAETVARWRVAYWQGLEDAERKEMHAHLHDETELAEDAADAAAGDKTFAVRRRQRAERRVTAGPAAGRWRRNFSDDLLNAHVNSEPEVATAKKALRQGKSQLHQATCVLKTIEHRSRAISHLCALHRDNRH